MPSSSSSPIISTLFLLGTLLSSHNFVIATDNPSVPEAASTNNDGLSSSGGGGIIPTGISPIAANVVTAQNTVKFLVCGDSISQGADGDFTWRYRLWEWFQANTNNNAPLASSSAKTAKDTSSTTTTTTTSAGTDTFITPTLQYVGPYNGTLPASAANDIDLSDPQTWGAYHPTINPAFYPGGGSDHFAVYGRPAWMDVDLIQEQVARYTPDFIVLHLGFNDFGWWGQTASELVESVHRLVNNARLGRADVKFLIADVSHRLLVKGREDIPTTTDDYNGLLKQQALGWSTVESPVLVVKVSEDYDCHVDSCPAGKDGLHPNALGDYQIARAYTKTLHDKYHFGAEALVVPNIEAIPGFQVLGAGSTSTIAGSAFGYPPVGVFIVVIILVLVGAVWFRLPARLMKGLRGLGSGVAGVGESKYQLLPTANTRETS